MRRFGALVLAVGLATPAWAGDWDDCNSTTPDRALKGCSRIINSSPDKRTDLAAAYAGRAGAHVRRGDHAAGKLDVEKALEIDERNGLAWAWRGHIQNHESNYKSAVASFDKAISFNPKDSGAWQGRATARVELGDSDAALSDANRALQIDPKDASLYSLRARINIERNRLEPAFGDVERAIAIDPKDWEGYYYRAQARRRAGQLDRALVDAEKVVSLQSEKSWDGFLLRGLIRGELGKPREGLVDVDRALAMKSNNGDAHGMRALLLIAMEDLDGAVRAANRAIEFKDSQGLEIRGIAFLRLGEFDQAITDLTQALKENTNDSGINARVARAQAYAMRQRFSEAVADMDAAVAATPWTPRERQSHALAKEKLPELRREAGPAKPATPTSTTPAATVDLSMQPQAVAKLSGSIGRELAAAPGSSTERARAWVMMGTSAAGYCVLRQYLTRGHVEYWRWSDGTATWVWFDERLRGDPARPVNVEVRFDEGPQRVWRWQATQGGALAVNVPETWLATTLPRFDRITLRSASVNATYTYSGFSRGFAELARCGS